MNPNGFCSKVRTMKPGQSTPNQSLSNADITIIGAGLSGTLLTMNLLMLSGNKKVHIRLVDRNGPEDLGPAYSTQEDYLLNVPVEIMGALSRDPAHFLNWTLQKKIPARKGDYLPRKLYREYVLEMLNNALRNKSSATHLERIRGEVLDIQPKGDRYRIFIKDRDDFTTDKVVLALGNSPPKNPGLRTGSFPTNGRYLQNPWGRDIFNNLSPTDTILFIGTGQTMVDLVTGLYRRKHKGQLIGISRRGVLPLSQKMVDPYPSFFHELEGQMDMLLIYQIVRKHLKNAAQQGLDYRSVIDSLRPHTQQIWMQLPISEKHRFLRHVFRYWEIIRSRIPPQSMAVIQEMQDSNQLNIIIGRIESMTENDQGLSVHYVERNTHESKSVTTDWVINCMGPNQDYDTIDQPLIKNLVRQKLIHTDPAHLGIDATPEGAVIDKDGNPSETLFTVGLPLKGIVWEALATPEIRVQAENLAERLLAD